MNATPKMPNGQTSAGYLSLAYSTLFFDTVLLPAAALVPFPLQASLHKSCGGEITVAGLQVAARLDAMDVESHGLAHQPVNWETEEADRGAEYEGPGKHTHCSAFAAAAAKRLGISLLRPPEHGQQLLANAPAKWLSGSQGRKNGWREIAGAQRARADANRGNLVLVVHANPDPHQPGHVAIVRPSEQSADALKRNGPQIIQAGTHNHNSTTVRIGFSGHPDAWPDGVRYFMHEL